MQFNLDHLQEISEKNIAIALNQSPHVSFECVIRPFKSRIEIEYQSLRFVGQYAIRRLKELLTRDLKTLTMCMRDSEPINSNPFPWGIE